MFGRKKREPEVEKPREYVAKIYFNGTRYNWHVYHPDTKWNDEWGNEVTEKLAIESAKKCISRLTAMDNYKPIEIRVPAHLETS